MQKLIVFCWLVVSLQILYAQSSRENMSGRVEATSQLLKELRATPNFDSLKQLAASDIDAKTKATTLFWITAAYLETSLDSSLRYIKQFNNLPFKPKFLEANGLAIMGDIYSRLGDPAMALENILKGTKTLQELKDSAGIGMAYWNLGKVYQSLDNAVKAKNYYLNSIKISSSAKDTTPLSFSMGNLGQLYMEADRIDSALYYTQLAYEIYKKETNQHSYDPILEVQLGNIYQKKGNTALAMKYYKTALEKATPKHNLYAGSDACLGMATLFKKDNRYDSSYYYAREGLNMAQRLNKTDLIWKASMFLKDFFTERNIPDSAFNYQEIMIATNDSMHNLEKINKAHIISFAEQQRIKEIVIQERELQANKRIYLLGALLTIFLIIAILLYINNRNKQRANALLESQKKEIQRTLTELKTTQAQLVQSEKMASLGELTAGIAHEIQNPLNFVNNFSEINQELIEELRKELETGNTRMATEIANDIKDNSEKINHHGKRADAIVKGMLQHSRKSSGQKELTDINALCDEYLRLAYHGLRAKDKSFNAKFETDFDNSISKINIVPQDIGRAILNLITNAFYAVSEKQKSEYLKPTTESLIYEPSVTVSTKRSPLGGKGAGPVSQTVRNEVKITVKDNGNGIPESLVNKIFQPFFTTKPVGQGTGLGLSLSYDIVKAHGGDLKVQTKEGAGTEFIILLPS